MIITNLLANMIVLTVQGTITNHAPVLQQYVFRAMLTNAQAMALEWHLDPELIDTTKVTHFEVIPYPDRITASILFDNRYLFSTGTDSFSGSFGSFEDKYYDERWLYEEGGRVVQHPWHAVAEILQKDLDIYRARPKRWLSATNLLTIRKAQQIARQVLRSLDRNAEKLGRKKPDLREQLMWTDCFRNGSLQANREFPPAKDLRGGTWGIVDMPDGSFLVSSSKENRSFGMPYYKFTWEGKRSDQREIYNIDVSGLTSNVVYCDYSFLVKPRFGLQIPTNYMEMLGLSTNTVFVRPRLTVPRTYETVP